MTSISSTGCARQELFDHFDHGPQTLTSSQHAGQSANRADGFAVFADDFPYVILMAAQLEDYGFVAGKFRQLDRFGVIHEIGEHLENILVKRHD